MKALFRDAIDGSLFFAEICYVSCSSDGSCLYFYSLFEDEIVIDGLSISECKDVIRDCYYKDHVDLTMYLARVDHTYEGEGDRDER